MDLKDMFKAVEKSSTKIIKGSNDLNKRVRSAKNYVANYTLDKWAFSKLIATENFNVRYGSAAKPFFKGYGFFNILELNDTTFKKHVTEQFLQWAENIRYFDIKAKFQKDQSKSSRFELLVHMDQIPKKILQKRDLLDTNLEDFIEGFKREIMVENGYRDKRLIRKVKERIEPVCCVCEFNFEERYGLHGKGFIEIHHIIPITKGIRRSELKDLVPVCSNCHRMLHKGPAVLSIEDLRRIIKQSAV